MIKFDESIPRRYLKGHLIWFAFWLAVTICGIILSPSVHGHGTHQQLGLPPCPSILLFGRPCPGCGLTTSFTATLHGQLATAWTAHPFGPFLYLIFTLSALASMYGYIKQRRFDTDSKPFNILMTTFFSALILFGIIRFATTRAFAVEEKSIFESSLGSK